MPLSRVRKVIVDMDVDILCVSFPQKKTNIRTVKNDPNSPEKHDEMGVFGQIASKINAEKSLIFG